MNGQIPQRTVYYQPTPLSPNISESLNHVRSGWLGSSYNTTLVRDGKLQVGGCGDQYRTYLKFDIDGLPKNADLAVFWLWAYSRGDNSTPVPLAVCKVGTAWDTGLTWNSQIFMSFPLCWGYYSAPIINQWWGAAITPWYNEWKNGTVTNNGLMLFPQFTNNQFNVFRSTSYADFSADPYADGKRPILQLNFVPTLELKLPFNGFRWSLSTEMGGVGCSEVSQGHMANGYFSLDFTPQAIKPDGNLAYQNPTSADIPILAAANGIISVSNRTNPQSSAGYHVRILHGNTGITTGYYHLKYPPVVFQNAPITQGQIIGYMGNTGPKSTGKHLDFNIQYNGSGDKNQDPLARVLIEGLVMKSYQVDACLGGQSRRYYPSSNTIR
ncbi:MAG: DNRLRE domain-containing protein [Minisyncoccota bacterium]